MPSLIAVGDIVPRRADGRDCTRSNHRMAKPGGAGDVGGSHVWDRPHRERVDAVLKPANARRSFKVGWEHVTKAHDHI